MDHEEYSSEQRRQFYKSQVAWLFDWQKSNINFICQFMIQYHHLRQQALRRSFILQISQGCTFQDPSYQEKDGIRLLT